MEGNNAAVDRREVKLGAGPLPHAAVMEARRIFARAGRPGFLGRFYSVFGASVAQEGSAPKGKRLRRPRCRLAASDAPPCRDGAPRCRQTTKLGVALALVTVFPCRDLRPAAKHRHHVGEAISSEQLRPT